jgi:hypothetical protein
VPSTGPLSNIVPLFSCYGSGQWEDALVLARSLYELNMNLSEIECSSDREQAARKFIRFGKFQQLRVEQRRLEDQLRDEKLERERINF